MTDPITPSPTVAPDNALAFWPRFRVTFGPALVGLLGGTLTVGIASSMIPVLRAVAATYSKYPSLAAPWPARDFSLLYPITILLCVLAVAATFGMGLVTARLVRPKGQWDAVSAGLMTAATASATAYVLWIGWIVTIAMVIVPSSSDMTLFGIASRTPTEATAHPSDLLTDKYPDLKAAPADERGQLFSNKIVSDQLISSVYSVWYGVILAVAVIGLPAFCGTLAGSWLLRRGGSRWSNLFSYLELTASTAVPLGLLFVQFLGSHDLPIAWYRYAALLIISAIVVAGVHGRWAWPIRLVAAYA